MSVSSNEGYGQPWRITIKSDWAYTMLLANTSGISLWDNRTNTRIGYVAWSST